MCVCEVKPQTTSVFWRRNDASRSPGVTTTMVAQMMMTTGDELDDGRLRIESNGSAKLSFYVEKEGKE